MKTGFEKLDNIIHNLNCGELTCIASRPGLGKTTLLIDIVNNISKNSDDKILFVSLENSKEQLEERIKNNNVELITDKLFINDIEDTCRSLSYKYHYLSLIVVDYLQLVKPEIRRKNLLREKIDIVKALKQLSIELNVPIIITSQLPRTNEKPKLEDLNVYDTTYHYSKVLLLHNDGSNLKIDVVKNKGVSHRFVDLVFNNEKLSFEERK